MSSGEYGRQGGNEFWGPIFAPIFRTQKLNFQIRAWIFKFVWRILCANLNIPTQFWIFDWGILFLPKFAASCDPFFSCRIASFALSSDSIALLTNDWDHKDENNCVVAPGRNNQWKFGWHVIVSPHKTNIPWSREHKGEYSAGILKADQSSTQYSWLRWSLTSKIRHNFQLTLIFVWLWISTQTKKE